jgi:hypothetical protein
MGMLDFLFGDKQAQQSKKLESLRKKLTNIWMQPPDRYQAADQLLELASPEAVRALLERFKVNISNTTYDIEEKQYLCDRLVTLGEPVVEIIKEAVRKEEIQVNWPMRVLEDLLPSADMAAFIQELLASMTLDYMRDPEKKEQLILRATTYKDFEELAREVARFAADDNEGIRFQTVSQVVTRDTDWAAEALRKNLRVEDSGRVMALSCQWFVEHPAFVAAADMGDIQEVMRLRDVLPREYVLTDTGHLRRR